MGIFDMIQSPEGMDLQPGPVLQPSAAPPPLVAPALLSGALGAPPMAPAPIPIPQAQPKTPAQQIMSMALLGLAAGLGPRRGNGIPQGLLEGSQLHQQEQEHKLAQEQAVVRNNQAIQDAQFKAQQQEYEKKAQTLQTALGSIAGDVKAIPDKATYDQRIEGYANLLQASGYRLDSNWLRRAVPYMAPSSKKLAQDAITAFFANPLTKEQLKNNPSAVANGSITVDLNGDGTKELVPLKRVMEASDMSPLLDDQGQVVGLSQGASTDGPIANIALKALLVKFRSENRREPTPKEMVGIIAEARKTPKDPNAGSAGNPDGVGADTLTKDSVEYVAAQYRLLGPSGIPTRLDETQKIRVINAATEQNKLLGNSPVAAVQKQAAYKSDAASLTKMKLMSSAAEAFENKALSQADIVADLNAKVNRTQYPIINDALLAGRARIAGDANTQLLFNALTTFTTEYAKIMEGSTGSAAGSSDASRAAAARLISAGLNKGTLAQTLELMKREMRLTIQGYGAVIERITDNMGGKVPAATEAAPEIWGRDPKTGKLVKQ